MAIVDELVDAILRNTGTSTAAVAVCVEKLRADDFLPTAAAQAKTEIETQRPRTNEPGFS